MAMKIKMHHCYVIFSILFMINTVWLQKCKERPIDIVVDSTNLTTRVDFEVFKGIIKNVSSSLREVYGNNNLSLNVYQYNSNSPCFKIKVKRLCIRRSINMTNISEISEQVKGHSNLSSLDYRRLSNQPFCLSCAQYILKEQLMNNSGNDSFGLILSVFPSLKKFINSSLHPQYKRNTTYIFALAYTSHNNTVNIPKRQPLTSTREISKSNELVGKILSYICPDEFDERIKRLGSVKPTKSSTVTSSLNNNGTSSFQSISKEAQNDRLLNTSSSVKVPINSSYNDIETSQVSIIMNLTSKISVVAHSIVDNQPSPGPLLESSSHLNIGYSSSLTVIDYDNYNDSVYASTLHKSKFISTSYMLLPFINHSYDISDKVLVGLSTSVAHSSISSKFITTKEAILHSKSKVNISTNNSPFSSYAENRTQFTSNELTLVKSSKQTIVLDDYTSTLILSEKEKGNSTKVYTTVPTKSSSSLISGNSSTSHVSEKTELFSSNTSVVLVKPSIQEVQLYSPYSLYSSHTLTTKTIENTSSIRLMNYSECINCSLLLSSSSILTELSPITSLAKSTNSSILTQKKSSFTPKLSKTVLNVSKSVSDLTTSLMSEFISIDHSFFMPKWNATTTTNSTQQFIILPTKTFSSTETILNITSVSWSQLAQQTSSNFSKPHILATSLSYQETIVFLTNTYNPEIIFSTKMLPSSTFLSRNVSSVSTVSSSKDYPLKPPSISIRTAFTAVTQLLFFTSITNVSSIFSLYTSSSVLLVIPVKKVIDKITFFMEQNITNLHMKQKIWVERFITNTSALLSNIEENEDSLIQKKSLNFLSFVENTTLKIGRQLPIGKNITFQRKDLKVEMTAINPSNFTGYMFIPEVDVSSEEKVQLSSNLFNNSSLIQNKVSITTMFMKTIPAMRRNQGVFQDIGKVFTISLDVDIVIPVEDMVTYTFKVPENNYSNYKCVFWNSTDWDTRGCSVANANGTSVVCQCNHMTSFSLLMQVSDIEIEEIHAYILSMISYIGCSISIVGCVLLLLVYVMFGRLLKVSRNVIHMNLALAIAISNALFISADSVHMYKGLCLTVSIAMLYSYLASFFWMLVEGIHVYLLIVKVFKSPSMMKVYFIIGWIVPAVIVAIAGLKFHINFTRDDFCWISTEGSVIWVFVGPVLSIVVINGVILITALSTSYKMAVAETDFLRLQQVARLTMLLMPIFGLTWVFGLLAINKQLLIFQYIFTIINSLQGVYIFICYCLLNNEVKQEFERIRRKYQYDSGNTTSSESHFSVYDQLFQRRLKSNISVDSSTMVKLTKYDSKLNRYDSVKTESTCASSTYSDTLTKRLNKDYSIELINLNDTSNITSINNETQSISSSVCPEEHEYGIKLNFEEVPLTNGHYSCGDFDTFKGKK